MRTLEINKTTLWYVKQTGSTKKTDSNGYYTGEIVPTFSTPTEIRIALYPSNGSVTEQIFGKDASLDMIGVSNDVVLDETCLLFITKPITGQNYFTTYDYSVSMIKKSLNTYQYGFKRRV